MKVCHRRAAPAAAGGLRRPARPGPAGRGSPIPRRAGPPAARAAGGPGGGSAGPAPYWVVHRCGIWNWKTVNLELGIRNLGIRTVLN